EAGRPARKRKSGAARRKERKAKQAARSLESLGLPTEREAVAAHLTGYKGVGQKTAEALIEAFGAAGVFAALHGQPDRVREVLGARRAEAVLEAWQADYRARTESQAAPAEAEPAPESAPQADHAGRPEPKKAGGGARAASKETAEEPAGPEAVAAVAESPVEAEAASPAAEQPEAQAEAPAIEAARPAKASRSRSRGRSRSNKSQTGTAAPKVEAAAQEAGAPSGKAAAAESSAEVVASETAAEAVPAEPAAQADAARPRSGSRRAGRRGGRKRKPAPAET